MKRVLISLLTACFTLSAFAQITQESSAQVVEVPKKPKTPKHAYSWQPFVVGGVAIGIPTATAIRFQEGVPTSFRLQAGMVKRWGFYVAGATNFRFAPPDGDYCEHPEDYEWTGKKHYNRWIIQAGSAIRFNPNLIMYFGTGFGRCVLLHETVDGYWMYSHHHHIAGNWTYLDLDLGFMYCIKSFVISAGFSSGTAFTRFYPTGNIGVGVMF